MFPTRPRTQYKSSKGVLTGISFAHSTFFNARGLEYPWNAPFLQAISELLAAYLEAGIILINSPYTIWAPRYKREEEEVKEQLLELGLYYDDLPAKCSSHTLKKLAETAHDTMERTTSIESLTEKISSLVAQRDRIVEDEGEWYRVRKEAGSKDFFDTTIDLEFIDMGQSFDRIPDIVVTLVGSIEGPPPSSLEQKQRSDLCGRRKSYYERIGIMVELKRGGNRKSGYAAYVQKCSNYIEEAVRQLAEYCSAYFASMPDKRKVRQDEEKLVVIAAGGQFWIWASGKPLRAGLWFYVRSLCNEVLPSDTRL